METPALEVIHRAGPTIGETERPLQAPSPKGASVVKKNKGKNIFFAFRYFDCERVNSMGIMVVLILGIFGFVRWQRLMWFEIKKKNIPQVPSQYLNFNLCRDASFPSIINNNGFWALNDQFSIPVKVMVQKICNSVSFILIIVATPRNFYRFLAIIILESITY